MYMTLVDVYVRIGAKHEEKASRFLFARRASALTFAGWMRDQGHIAVVA